MRTTSPPCRNSSTNFAAGAKNFNRPQLQPLLPRSDLTQELEPVSTNLHHVSQTGLDAIGYLREHRSPPAGWKTKQLAFLKQSEKPQAILLNMVAPAVLKLVQATP